MRWLREDVAVSRWVVILLWANCIIAFLTGITPWAVNHLRPDPVHIHTHPGCTTRIDGNDVYVRCDGD